MSEKTECLSETVGEAKNDDAIAALKELAEPLKKVLLELNVTVPESPEDARR